MTNFSRGHRAKKTVVDNIPFASKKEAARYNHLKMFQKAGIIRSFTVQPRFLLQPAFRKCCGLILGENAKKCPACGKLPKHYAREEYVADFQIMMPDGSIRVEDVKGDILTDLFKSKRKRFEFLFPHLTLSIIENEKVVPK